MSLFIFYVLFYPIQYYFILILVLNLLDSESKTKKYFGQ